ncbi:hypothetical protein H9Q69_009521 [Fusarium xylarioides]|nr:hypothetical protein H9Q69_009521 [Fusarium xylarioides]
MHRTLRGLVAVFGVAFASLQAPENSAGDLVKRSARGYAPTLEIQNPVLTSKWVEDSDFVQVLEMIIYNSHSTNYLTLADTLNVTLTSDSLVLVRPGTLTRLAPKQGAVVQIGVKNKLAVSRGSQCSGTVVTTRV